MSDIRHRLRKANELAQKNLKAAQAGMKTWYDKRARTRVFKPGDQVLVLLPIHSQLVIVDLLLLPRELMRWITLSTHLDAEKQDDFAISICSRVMKKQNKVVVNQ